MFSLVAVLAALSLFGCSRNTSATSQNTSPKIGPNVLTNGLVGLKISAFGEVDQMFVDSYYDTTGEEKIQPWSKPLAVRLQGGSDTVSSEQLIVGKQFVQRGKDVTITWELTPNESKIHLTVTHPKAITVALENDPRLTVSPEKKTVTDESWWLEPKPGPGIAARLPAPGAEPHAQIGGTPDDKLIASLVDNLSTGVGRIPSPMGLTSTQYNGHVFWDADVWMLPALAFVAPSRAKMIANYRIATVGAARKNYDDWTKADRPTGNAQKLGPGGASGGIKFPWEASQTGAETVPGESKFQDHISGSVMWGLDFGHQSGLVGLSEVQPVREGVAKFYMSRTVRKSDLSPLSLPNTMSPDEFHTGDNDLYTNILAERAINSFIPGSKLVRPSDTNSLLNYDGDKLKGYKQAAGVLAIYPLQDYQAEQQAEKMLRRFMPGVTKNGPAMTDSVHATILARLGHADEAYKLWLDNLKQFTDHPNLAFSEKRNADKTYFYTGAAGFLNTVLYGFAGLRLDKDKNPSAKWTHQLASGSWINVLPHLPKAWPKLEIKGLWLDGKQLNFVITNDQVTVTP